MTQIDITERRCNVCGRRKQRRKNEIGGTPFRGWYQLRTLTRDGWEEYDVCGTACLMRFAVAEAKED